ncbi:MAG: alpha/beta hydrolase [Desulfobacterales bacterium]
MRKISGFRNLEKIRGFDKPTLIIHAELDPIIPSSEGEALYNACSASNKKLVKIPGANLNDIFMRGFKAYMAAMGAFAKALSSGAE